MARSPIRATLRDIAQRAGCHYSTVSLALREHPRIPEVTRVRIQQIAQQLGYRPDAMLAALCAYREQKQIARRGVIGWLTNHSVERGWRNSACNRDYFEGASARSAERGYQRLGLVNRRDHDERVDHNWLAAYLVEQNQLHRKNRLPPLILDRWHDQAFLDWFRAHRPDAIVTRLPEVLASLRAAGRRVPDDVGVAFHSLDEGRKGFSGMKKNSFQIGVMAVDLLVDMLHRNERGIPEIPYRLMVEGSWCEGKTLLNEQRTRLKLVRVTDDK